MPKIEHVESCITRFPTGFNNFRGCLRKLCKSHSVISVSIHAHFMLDGHSDIDDWEIIYPSCLRKTSFVHVDFSRT